MSANLTTPLGFSFDDGVIRAKDWSNHWVTIEWLTPGVRKFRAVKDVKEIELVISQLGYLGWLMASEKTHTTMHPIIEKLGGKKYAEDKEHYFYMKVVA